MSNELETLKQLLSNFIGAVQQSGIITPATGEKPIIGGDFYAATIEALSKRVTVLEAALSQAHDTRERERDTIIEAVKEWVRENAGVGVKKEDLDDAISNYLHINDYMDADGVDSKVEEMLSDHDFSRSPKLKRMVQDAVDEADLEDAVRNALDSMTLNRHLDLSDLASDLDGELDIDSKVSDALDNIDLNDKLDISTAVQEQVDEKLGDYDFSEALKNTLSDDQVVEALLKTMLERVNKTLMREDEKKDE